MPRHFLGGLGAAVFCSSATQECGLPFSKFTKSHAMLVKLLCKCQGFESRLAFWDCASCLAAVLSIPKIAPGRVCLSPRSLVCLGLGRAKWSAGMGAHSSVLPTTAVLDLAWVQQSPIAQQDLGTPAFPRTELVVRKAQRLDIKPVDITHCCQPQLCHVSRTCWVCAWVEAGAGENRGTSAFLRLD